MPSPTACRSDATHSTRTNVQPQTLERDADFLMQHLKALPAFRALLRAVEARLYQGLLPIDEPVLDLGCGDGHFASVAFPRPITAGIDPAGGMLREAQGWGAYRLLSQSVGSALPFADGHFVTVISNSVLEHIPDVDAVLAEVYRVLAEGGRFIFCVPSDHFTGMLLFSQLFRRLRLKALARAYERYFNRMARHYHCDGPQVWQARLVRAGLHLVDAFYYFSVRANRVLDAGHYWGVPNLITKKLFGRWVLFPSRRNLVLALTDRLLRPLYEEPLPNVGACLFLVAGKWDAHASLRDPTSEKGGIYPAGNMSDASV
jgi:SAM-dependent methyltransferase